MISRVGFGAGLPKGARKTPVPLVRDHCRPGPIAQQVHSRRQRLREIGFPLYMKQKNA